MHQPTRPAKPAPSTPDLPCCKDLYAVPGTVSVSWVTITDAIGAIEFCCALPQSLTQAHPLLRITLDTGPPGPSFAESVLQKSTLAHAPPCAVS